MQEGTFRFGREPPNEEGKDGPLEHTLFKVCLEHCQLVEIREKGIYGRSKAVDR